MVKCCFFSKKSIMIYIASFLVLMLSGPATVTSLICLQCPNVNSTSSCHVNVACAPDEHCYTEKRYASTLSRYYSMGCVKSLYCPRNDTDVIVGKKDTLREDVKVHDKLKREALCFQCCSTDNCNKFLCDVVFPTEKPEAQTSGTELRLIGGYTKYEGNVEVFYNNSWGSICDDGWNNTTAEIVCSMLGFQKSDAVPISGNGFHTPNKWYWLDDVACSSNATTLWSCSHRPWGENNCGSSLNKNAGVKCYPDTEVSSIAIDPVHGIVFYSDNGLGVIVSVNVDGSNYTHVISSNLNIPRSIALISASEKIFWTEWGVVPKIESAKYDGTARTVLATTNLKWPTSLSIDYTENRLYFMDGGMGTIESMDLKGSFRTVILHDPAVRLFSLDVFSEYIYFTALEKNGPYTVKKDGSGLSPIGPQDFIRLSQIKFYKYGTDYTACNGLPEPARKTNDGRIKSID